MGIQINGQTDTISAVDNSFSLAGNVSIGGTLTYEDVTNVDAVGLSTFQAGINVGPKTGIACTISSAGAITAAGKLTVGAGLAQGSKPIEVNTLDGFDRFVVSGGGTITATGDLTLTDSSGSIGRSIDLGGGSNWGIRSNPTSGTNSYGFDIYKSTGDVKLSIDSDGKVGINTNDPQKTLHVNSSADNSFGIVRISGKNRGGQLEFCTDATKTAGIYSPTSSNELVFFTSSSETERLRINSAGAVLPGSDNGQDLGSSSKRWANLYTGDLQLSNEGGVNDVDGTWGQYTIQEGEDDLFLINRRSGKKYKFMLQEVN